MTQLWRRLVRRLVRRGRIPGVRTAKTTLAAVLSFVLAERLGTSADPVLAPLTALLVVQLTMYETVASGIGRVASVVAGVSIAVLVADVTGLTWWSLATVVALSLVLGQLLRLGQHLLEVPISAMIVLAVGGAGDQAAGRIVETLLGAAVGIAVNVVVAAPLHVQPATDALEELAEHMADFLHRLAADLRQEWSRSAAERWLQGARGLGQEVAHAERTLARAEQSARFNPRGSRARTAQPRLRTGLTAIEHASVALRSLCRALLDRTFFVPEDEQGQAYPEPARRALADVLDTAADALQDAARYAVTSTDQQAARVAVEQRLVELHQRRDALGEVLLVDRHTDAGAWQQHGALLAGVDRLRVELDAAARPGEAWRPSSLTERPRELVRRAVEVPIERRRRGRRAP